MSEAVAKPVQPAAAARRAKNVHDLIESEDFKSLVRRRWTLNIALLAALFVTYYGFILLIAYAKPLLNTKIGQYTTLGIPIGVAVIVIGWVLTAIYVGWSNSKYDPEAERLKKQL